MGKEEECTVPHVVDSKRGYNIVATCASNTKELLVTAGHLIYTERGLQAANEILPGDTVFGNLGESDRCKVEEIQPVLSNQKYFGLNCHNSVVLASGIKSSTFEKLHALPSFWMSIMSKIVGVKRASHIGVLIEKMVLKTGLLL
jgi:hypothetical protein